MSVGGFLLLQDRPQKPAVSERLDHLQISCVSEKCQANTLNIKLQMTKDVDSLKAAVKPCIFTRLRCGPMRQILNRREFYLLWITRFAMVLISQCISGLNKAYGLKALAFSDGFLTAVGAVAGIFNCGGRLAFGYLVDKISYKYVRVEISAFSMKRQIFLYT